MARTPKSPKSTPKTNPLDAFAGRMGNAPDATVAAEAGVGVDTVKAYRKEHNIAPYRKGPPAVEAAPPVEKKAEGTTVKRRRTKEDGTTSEVVSVAAAPAAPADPLDAYLDQMGKIADGEIATRAGVSRKSIVMYRQARNIPAYTGHLAARKESAEPAAKAKGNISAIEPYADQLGRTPDAEIAGLSGVSEAAVAAERERRGIAAFVEDSGDKSGLMRFWDRFGKVSDDVIAAEAGVKRTTVGAFRRKHGLPAYRGHWERGARAAVETVAAPARAAAKPAQEPVESAEKRFRKGKLDKFKHLMGKESDAAIAKLANATPGGVKAYRERHGIGAAPRGRAAKAAAAPVVAAPVVAAPVVAAPVVAAPVAAADATGLRSSKLDGYRHIVGVLFDSEVAKVAGVTAEAVRLYRKKRDIPAGALRELPASAKEPVAAVPRAAEAVAPVAAPVVVEAPVAVEAAPVKRGPGRPRKVVAPAAEVKEAAAPVVAEPVVAAAPVVAAPVAAPAPVVAAPAPVVAAPKAPEAAAPADPQSGFTVVAVSKSGAEKRFVVLGRNIGVAAARAIQALAGRTDGPWRIRSMKEIAEAIG